MSYIKDAGGGSGTLPPQAGHSGEFLTTNGTNPSWLAIPGGGDMLAAIYDAAGITEQLLGLTAAQLVTNKSIDADANIITNIDNADIKAAAAIALTKLAATTASRALVSDASGFIIPATTTAAEIGFVNGVTSAIQTQLNAKQALDSTLTALAAYNTNGILTQTAADTFTGRTIVAGSAKIAVTNGSGVLGNPSIDLGSVASTDLSDSASILLTTAIGVTIQAFDATLASLAAYNTNGILTQTAADTFTGRTITGTANEVTVTNGDGVAGNPTLSLPSGISATKIGGGGVTSSEFDFLSGVTSDIQTQINAKQASDSTLTALAAYNTNGILTQTAADTFTGRTITGTTGQVTVTNGDGVAGNPTLSLPSNARVSIVGGGVDGGGAAIATGKIKGFFTVPYSGTITAWNITVDTGTVTIKAWKIATGTAKPTSANSINTSGIDISTGTNVRSTTLTDFTTTTVAANDIFAFNIETISGPTELSVSLEITRT